MKKAGLIISIVLVIVVALTATGISLAWFSDSTSESGTIVLDAAAPTAELYILVRSVSQTGGELDTLKPAIAALDGNGAPMYATAPDYNFSTLDMTDSQSAYISSAAQAVTVTMEIAYQGEPDSLSTTKTVSLSCAVTREGGQTNCADEFKFETSLFAEGSSTNANADLDMSIDLVPYTMYTVSVKICFKHFDDNVPAELLNAMLAFTFNVDSGGGG